MPDLPALKPLPPVEHPAGTALAGMHVMVVDDDPRSIVALSALLRRVELKVLSAERGEHGVTLLRGTPDIDLVLVDIMMPGMDGYATMRAMRELPSGERIPLVASTAKVEAGERQRCLDAGASAYVTKPVDTAQLLEVLGEWLPASEDVPPTPDDRPPALKSLPTNEKRGGSHVAGMKVLVVDDDFRNVFPLSALLERVNVETLSAGNGNQGIQLLSQSPDVDLVLVDIMMPGMDGYATMRAMRELPSGTDVPLVAVTAKVEAGERQRCIEAGASGYVPKPVDAAQLLDVLGEWYPPVTSVGQGEPQVVHAGSVGSDRQAVRSA
jgi:CheY-like chemotaxis protein